ncbi:hypothetical protein LguiB_027421 [Lonicera macranthoides]
MKRQKKRPNKLKTGHTKHEKNPRTKVARKNNSIKIKLTIFNPYDIIIII